MRRFFKPHSLAAAALLILLCAAPALAQSVQVAFTGFPLSGALESPFVADLEERVQDGTYGLRVTVVGAAAQRFSFRFLIETGGQELPPVDTRPITREPGVHFIALDDLSFVFTGGLNGYLSDAGGLAAQIVRTGRLSNGTTSLAVEVLSSPDEMFLGEGRLDLEARLPEPATLLLPADQSTLSEGEPLIFAWDPLSSFDLPAGARVAYEVVAALYDPVLHDGNPENAILQPLDGEFVVYESLEIGGAQVTHWKTDEATGLVLQPGQLYAWRVGSQVTLADGTLLDGLFNDGLSEIFTFEYEAQEVVWAFPLFGNPLVEFDLTGAFESEGLVGDAAYRGTLLGDEDVAEFEGVQIRGGSLLAGRLVMRAPLRVVHTLGADGQMVDAVVGRAGEASVPPSALAFALDPLVLTPFGLTTTAPNLPVEARLPGMEEQAVSARVSGGFALSAQDYSVVRGALALYAGGAPVAVYDAGGLRMTNVDPFGGDDEMPPPPAGFALPEAAPLVSERVGVLTLRAGDIDLVDYTNGGADRLRLASKPGQTVPLRLDVLPGAPTVDIAFTDLGFNQVTGRIERGAFEADLAAPIRLPGTPYQARRVAYDGTDGLLLYGELLVDGAPITEPGAVVVRVGAAGQYAQELDLTDLPGTLRLSEGVPAERGAVSLSRVRGDLSGTTESGSFRLSLSGELRVGPAGAPGIRVPVTLGYDAGGLRVASVGTPQTGTLDLGSVRLIVDEVLPGTAVRRSGEGFAFTIPLSARLRMPLAQGREAERIDVRMAGLTLSASGFTLPSYDRHDALPGFEEQRVLLPGAAGRLTLDLIAARSGPVQFDYFSWDGDTETGLPPTMDFAVSQPGAGLPLSGLSLTLQGATYDESAEVGALVGPLLARDVAPDERPGFSVAGLGLRTAEVAGVFLASDGQPSYELALTAEIGALAEDAPSDCAAAPIRLTMTPDQLAGAAEGVALCGTVALTPFDLGFPSAQVAARWTESGRTATVTGSPTVALSESMLSAEGSLSLQLGLNGATISDGQVEVAQPFDWSYVPGGGGALEFRLPGARLSASGVTVDGDGFLRTTSSTSVAARFGGATITADGRLSGGEIRVGEAFDLHLPVANESGSVLNRPGALAVRPAGMSPRAGRLALRASSAVLTPQGLNVEVATGALFVQGGGEEVTVVSDEFRIVRGGDARAFSGRLDLQRDAQTRLAYLDANGFTLDAYSLPGLPARVPLGALVSLVTVGADGAPLFDLEPTGSRFRATLASGAQPTLEVRASTDSEPFTVPVRLERDLLLDRTYRIASADLVADVPAGAPLRLTSGGVPLQITRLTYAKSSVGEPLLRADGRAVLPAGLSSLGLAFSGVNVEGGWSAAAQNGRPDAPAASATYQQGALRIDVISFAPEAQTSTWTLRARAVPTLLSNVDGSELSFPISATFASGAWQATAGAPDPLAQRVLFESSSLGGLTASPVLDDTGYRIALGGTMALDGPDAILVEISGLTVGTDSLSGGATSPFEREVELFGGALSMTTTFAPRFDMAGPSPRLHFVAEPTQTAALLGQEFALVAGAASIALYAGGAIATTGGDALANPPTALNSIWRVGAASVRLGTSVPGGTNLSPRPVLTLGTRVDLPSVVAPEGTEASVPATVRLYRGGADARGPVLTTAALETPQSVVGARYPLPDGTSAELTGLLLDLDVARDIRTVRGFADLHIPHLETSQTRRVRFGDPARPSYWGFRARRVGAADAPLEWKLAPKSMQPRDLTIRLSGIRIGAERFAPLADGARFGVVIGGGISLGLSRAPVAQWDGLTYDANGLLSTGTNDGSFSLLDRRRADRGRHRAGHLGERYDDHDHAHHHDERAARSRPQRRRRDAGAHRRGRGDAPDGVRSRAYR